MISPVARSPLVHFCQSPSAAALRSRGFTLVETALALGIIAFAMVPLVGMLPLGMRISRSATDAMLSAQIAQRLAGMIQQADYSSLSADNSIAKVYYYFDSDGQPIKQTGSTAPASAIYAASILLPSSNALTASLVDSTNVTTLSIQIVNDPAHRLQGTPTANPPSDLQARTVTVPVYLANNGS